MKRKLHECKNDPGFDTSFQQNMQKGKDDQNMEFHFLQLSKPRVLMVLSFFFNGFYFEKQSLPQETKSLIQ